MCLHSSALSALRYGVCPTSSPRRRGGSPDPAYSVPLPLPPARRQVVGAAHCPYAFRRRLFSAPTRLALVRSSSRWQRWALSTVPGVARYLKAADGMGTPEPLFFDSPFRVRPGQARGSPSSVGEQIPPRIGTVEIERGRPIEHDTAPLPPGTSEQTRFECRSWDRVIVRLPRRSLRLRNYPLALWC